MAPTPKLPNPKSQKPAGSGSRKGQKYQKQRHLTINEAAKLLVDCTILGDKGACAKHKVHFNSLKHCKNRLDREPELKARVLYYQAKLDNEWASDIPKAIKRVIAFISRAADEADPQDPEAIKALVEAANKLAGIEAAKYVLNMRIREQRRYGLERFHPNPLLAPAPETPGNSPGGADSAIIEVELVSESVAGPDGGNRPAYPERGQSAPGNGPVRAESEIDAEVIHEPRGPTAEDIGRGGRHRDWEHK